MARMIDRSLLTNAKKSKNDEFYTQREDINRELQYYEHHFEGKTVYCNTDVPTRSNFVRYFIDNFARLGIKKLIATGYADGASKQGSYFSYTGKQGELAQLNNGLVQPLIGDGDFRSAECIDLLKQADIVVTNPPYSLLRQFISYMDLYEKSFLSIATVNALTYKEVFQLIHSGKIWLGMGLGRDISGFIVPDHYELYGTEARVNERGERIVSSNNSLWLTNLDFERRHTEIPLVKKYEGHQEDYPRYDNLDAINVNRTKDIPSDWFGLMGVPVTFLHKHNPEQFEIVGSRKGSDGKDLRVNGKQPYFRVIIKRKTNSTADQLNSVPDGQTKIF